MDFAKRLDWKTRLHGQPATSTPKQTCDVDVDVSSESKLKSRLRKRNPDNSTVKSSTSTATPTLISRARVSTKDIQSCFGFDDSEEENYADMISPIAMVKNKNPKLPLTKTAQADSVVARPARVRGAVGFDALLHGYGKRRDKDDNDLDPAPAKPKTIRRRKEAKAKVPVAVQKRKQSRSKRSSRLTNKLGVSSVTDESDLGPEIKQRLELENKYLENFPLTKTVASGVAGSHGAEGFDALLHRYGKRDDDIHFDTGKLKTYVHVRSEVPAEAKKAQVPVPVKAIKRKQRKSKSQRSSRLTNKHKHEFSSDESNLDPEIKRWLELKNKEFDDVLHVPLVVANTNSNSTRDA